MSKKVLYDEIAILAIERYIRQYREYFEQLYSDTGIFSEKQIIEQYIQNARTRREELFDLIDTRFSEDILLGRDYSDTLSLRWNTKTLWVSWKDNEDTRIITNILISSR